MDMEHLFNNFFVEPRKLSSNKRANSEVIINEP